MGCVARHRPFVPHIDECETQVGAPRPQQPHVSSMCLHAYGAEHVRDSQPERALAFAQKKEHHRKGSAQQDEHGTATVLYSWRAAREHTRGRLERSAH